MGNKQQLFSKNKRYYRLHELERVSPINHFDYLYFCEQFKDSINVYIHKHPILITNDFWSDKTYCGHSVFSGLIRLTRTDKISILQDKKVRVYEFQIEERDSISSYSTDLPFQLFRNHIIEKCGREFALNGIEKTFYLMVFELQNHNMMVHLIGICYYLHQTIIFNELNLLSVIMRYKKMVMKGG